MSLARGGWAGEDSSEQHSGVAPGNKAARPAASGPSVGAVAVAAPAGAPGASRRRPPKRPEGSVTLRTLVEQGVLTAGVGVISMEYKGQSTTASLGDDGRIQWRDMFFESPSAFSIFIKRLTTPGRKADDGWKTVRYAGQLLERYKHAYLAQRDGTAAAAGAASGGAAGGFGPDDSGGFGVAGGSRSVGGGGPARSGCSSGAPTPAASDGFGGAPDAEGGPGGARKRLRPAGAAASEGAATAGARPRVRVRLQQRGGAAAGASPAASAPLPPRSGGATPRARSPLGPLSSGAGGATSTSGTFAPGGAFSGSGARLENTPRPADLAALPVAQHEFAPAEGEVPVDGGHPDPLPGSGSGPRWFLSGADLAGLEPAADAADGAASPLLGGSGASAAPAAASGSVASGRPRRTIRAPARLIDSAAMGRDDHAMVPCEAFPGGPPGSGAPGAQPFRVQVAPAAEVVMDFHAHMDKHEVIGLLAGSWHPAERVLRVERALPVREALASGSDGTNVEMDTDDQFKIQEVISDLYGLRVVGWYHSHPAFPPLPSVIDISNHLLAQRDSRDPSAGGCEPYVAAIVSPYDKRLPASASAVTWFSVEYDRARPPVPGRGPLEQGCVPVELSVERLLRPNTEDALLRLLDPRGPLRALALRYACKRSAANLAAPWRGGASQLAKMIGSVASWLPQDVAAATRERVPRLLRLLVAEVRLLSGLPPLETDAGLEAATTEHGHSPLTEPGSGGQPSPQHTQQEPQQQPSGPAEPQQLWQQQGDEPPPPRSPLALEAHTALGAAFCPPTAAGGGSGPQLYAPALYLPQAPAGASGFPPGGGAVAEALLLAPPVGVGGPPGGGLDFSGDCAGAMPDFTFYPHV